MSLGSFARGTKFSVHLFTFMFIEKKSLTIQKYARILQVFPKQGTVFYRRKFMSHCIGKNMMKLLTNKIKDDSSIFMFFSFFFMYKFFLETLVDICEVTILEVLIGVNS